MVDLKVVHRLKSGCLWGTSKLLNKTPYHLISFISIIYVKLVCDMSLQLKITKIN